MNLPASFEQMIESKYLKKEDVTPDKLYTIRHFELVNAAQEGESPEMKWCMYFEEVDKGILLNSTNIQLMKLALGVEGPAQAIGRKIVLFNDPTVSFGGKLVGGIRLRAPRLRQPKPAPAKPASVPNAETLEDLDSDIPF